MMDDNNQPKTTNIPVMDVQAPGSDDGGMTPQPQMEMSSDNRPNLSMPELPAHAKKKSPMVLIVVVIIIALALAAGAVYYYMNSNKEDKTTTNTTASTTQTSKVSAHDVNVAKDEVEKSVNSLDDTKDLSSNDLSDSTLGL